MQRLKELLPGSALEGCVPNCGSLSFLSLVGVWQYLRTPAAMGSTGLFQRCAAVPSLWSVSSL